MEPCAPFFISMKKIFLITLLLVSHHTYAMDDRQIECLAKNVYFEARGEPEKGQLAVAHVVLNRIRSNDYPSNICDVVYQPNQFNWTSKHKVKINDWSLFYSIKDLVTHVIMNKSIDPTNGALYFRHKKLRLKSKKSIVIGNHIFYT